MDFVHPQERAEGPSLLERLNGPQLHVAGFGSIAARALRWTGGASFGCPGPTRAYGE